MKIVQLEVFKREILEFPAETREDIFSLVTRFMIDKNTKIQEFKLKDARGNWRAISTIVQGQYLVFVYAFHKKSQELLEKDKDVIRNRIRRIEV